MSGDGGDLPGSAPSAAMHERVSVNTLCFPGKTFSELAGLWAALRPRRVGLVTSLLLDEGVDAARTALASGDYRLDVLSHQFLAGDLSPDEETWAEPRARLSKVLAMGRDLGARCIYVAGGGHGRDKWEAAAAHFSAAIAPCAAQAREAGIELMIETSNPLYANSQIAHNLRDTVTLAEMAGIGVCVDIFACWTEAGLKETIRRAAPRCHLVQVSDWRYGDRALPCRSVPGDGVIPLQRICGWLLEEGYAGAFDLELIGPRIEAEGPLQAVGRAGRYMGDLLRALGV